MASGQSLRHDADEGRIESDGKLVVCGRAVKSERFDCRQEGFRAAFNRVSAGACAGCWCGSLIKANYIFALNSDALRNAARMC